MDASTAEGGMVLLVLIVVGLVVIGLLIRAMFKGFDKVERYERDKAIARRVREEYLDANARQAAARRLLQQQQGH